jgi:Rrf2 family protein
MKISKRTRYGLRMMIELALNDGKGSLNLTEIAAREEISLKYLSQIIIPLKSTGLVQSTRGSAGGYTLAKPAESITVRDILAALEGEMDIVECVEDPSQCERNAFCTARGVWSRLNESITQVLSSMNLKGLAQETEKTMGKHTITYQI